MQTPHAPRGAHGADGVQAPCIDAAISDLWRGVSAQLLSWWLVGPKGQPAHPLQRWPAAVCTLARPALWLDRAMQGWIARVLPSSIHAQPRVAPLLALSALPVPWPSTSMPGLAWEPPFGRVSSWPVCVSTSSSSGKLPASLPVPPYLRTSTYTGHASSPSP